jgi:hypothetical protein
MGNYSGIGDAKVFKGGGQYFKPGRYKVAIQAVKWVNAAVGGKQFTVIETKVLESNNPEVPVGCERSQVIDMIGVMGLPTVKAFVAAVSGFDGTVSSLNSDVERYWAGITGETRDFAGVCDLIASDVNPLSDEVMDLECIEVDTRTGGKFTKHVWATRVAA